MSHIVLSNNKVLCRGCGNAYDLFPNGQSREIWEMADLQRGFAEQHAHCAPKGAADANLRCSLCGMQGHDFEGCNAAHGLTKETWINGHDTGLSSKTLWYFMMGRDFSLLGWYGPAAPLDPSDFGRCYRLLLLAPEWRARMPEMAAVKGWARLAPAWEELTALFLKERKRKDGNAPKLYKRMQELGGR